MFSLDKHFGGAKALFCCVNHLHRIVNRLMVNSAYVEAWGKPTISFGGNAPFSKRGNEATNKWFFSYKSKKTNEKPNYMRLMY